MTSTSHSDLSNGLVDQAAQSADHAVKSARRMGNEALDTVSGTIKDLRNQAGPMLNRASEDVSTMAKRGVDAVRDTTQQLRDKASQTSENMVSYIKEEPIKAMLIAAAAGAALMALLSLISSARSRN